MANSGRLNEGSQVKDLQAFSSDKFNGESQIYDDDDGNDDYSPRRHRLDMEQSERVGPNPEQHDLTNQLKSVIVVYRSSESGCRYLCTI